MVELGFLGRWAFAGIHLEFLIPHDSFLLFFLRWHDFFKRMEWRFVCPHVVGARIAG